MSDDTMSVASFSVLPALPADPATDRTCPKCHREALPAESACARCGLLVARFDLFRESGDPPELDEAWRDCLLAWDDGLAHDRALSVAVRLECLPLLARRYRERLEAGADALAERRLSQIAVLIESAIRSQAGQAVGGKAARVVWLVGYLVAGTVLFLSAWICLLAMRHHG